MGHVSVDGVPSIPTASSPSGLGAHQPFKTLSQPPLQVIYTCRSETWITVSNLWYILEKLI